MRLGSSLTTFPGFGKASSLPCTIYEHHISIRSTAALLVCVEHLVLSSQFITKELALPACVCSRPTTIFRRIVTNQHDISTSNIPNNSSQSQRAQEEHSCTLLGPLFFTSILPVVLYFILKYGASLSPHTTFIIILPVIGLPALFGFVVRTYKLVRFQDYRPLGCNTWWTFDYFHFNFILGIIYVVILFTFGNTEDETNMRLLSLYLPLVMFRLSGPFILVRLVDFCGLRTPFRISSSPKGSSIPSGAAVVAEDIIAVDGSCEAEFRAAWQARLAISPAAARTAFRMDWLWGVSGLSCGAVLMVIVFTADNPDIGFALGKFSSGSGT